MMDEVVEIIKAQVDVRPNPLLQPQGHLKLCVGGGRGDAEGSESLTQSSLPHAMTQFSPWKATQTQLR